MFFYSSGKFNIAFQLYVDSIHHLKIILLSELLNLGYNFSCKSLIQKLLIQGRIQNCKHVVFHRHCETLFSGDFNIHHIFCNFEILGTQRHFKNVMSQKLLVIHLGQILAKCPYIASHYRSCNFKIGF